MIPADQSSARRPTHVLARMEPLAGHEDQVEMLLREYAVHVRSSPGTLEFRVFRERREEGSLVVLETYRDDEAFAQHLADESGRAFNAELASHVSGGESAVTLLDVVDA